MINKIINKHNKNLVGFDLRPTVLETKRMIHLAITDNTLFVEFLL